MPKKSKPRKGSLQFWPRVRAKRIYARVRSWSKLDAIKLLGFAGYKVGMAHILFRDTRKNTNTRNMDVSWPVTIIECPPLKVFSIRFYKKTGYGSRLITEVIAGKLEKELSRKVKVPKKEKERKIELNDLDEVRVVLFTQPKLTGIGKKKPELFEVAISGKNIEEKYTYAKSLLDKEIKIGDVFKEGQLVDIHAVTKGKGFQGPIKRFGIGLKQHKSEKKRRSAGNLGAWTPKKVLFSVPQAGNMGFSQRMEHNKHVLMLSDDFKKINRKGGIKHYGLVKNDFILVKGSVAGAVKRLIRINEPIRGRKVEQIEISNIIK